MLHAAHIKDHYSEQKLFIRRTLITAAIIGCSMLVLILRLTWLQVIKYDYFLNLSQGNRIRIEPLPPNRGLILDRKGTPLALNVPSFQLELTREQVDNLDTTLQGLANLQLLDREDIVNLKRDILKRRSFETIPLKLQLNEEELARFAVRRQEFPGVEIRPRLARYYPLGTSAVHALGYVGAISESDQKNIKMDDYLGTTLIGKSGLERRYESVLHGQAGFRQQLVNAQGRHVEQSSAQAAELSQRDPISGDDLYLTIDEQLQQVAEAAVKGRRAAVVALDPNNGDVLVLVSTPGFDPNLFGRGLTRAQYKALVENIDQPMYDRALRGAYPPGSTVKPLMALAALEYNIILPETLHFCRGYYTLPGSTHRYRDWKPSGHGWVNMKNAIAQSCDTYFYDVAKVLGIDRIYNFLNQFNFGRPVGIDISGEASGILPSTAWKQRNFRNKEAQTWFPGETIITGIGQGYMTVTPLQLAHATATIAMHGKRFQPRLVSTIHNTTNGKITKLPPLALPPVQVHDSKDWDIIIQGMIEVTTSGTARGSSAGAQYSIAGKTGTAQVYAVGQNEKYNASKIAERLRDHALYVAFAPAEAPKIVVAVVVENGEHGATTAAPVARQLFDAYLLPTAANTTHKEPTAATADSEE